MDARNHCGGQEEIVAAGYLCQTALTNIRVLDFYRYKEILAGVQEEVQRFKDTLQNLL